MALGGIGVWTSVPVAVHVAAIWAGHIGLDRWLGYGLKFPTGLKDTHLSEQPAPVTAFIDSE